MKQIQLFKIDLEIALHRCVWDTLAFDIYFLTWEFVLDDLEENTFPHSDPFSGHVPECNTRWNIWTCKGREDWWKWLGDSAVHFLENSCSFGQHREYINTGMLPTAFRFNNYRSSDFLLHAISTASVVDRMSIPILHLFHNFFNILNSVSHHCST